MHGISAWTAVSAVLVFVAGQVILRFCLEPLHDFHKVRGEIVEALTFYADVYSNPGRGRDELLDEAHRTLRQLASRILSKAFGIVFYRAWSAFGVIPSFEDVRVAAGNLIGLSSTELTQLDFGSAPPCYALDHAVMGKVEEVLKRAGATSAHWHSRQDSIQRDVYDITFFLEEAFRAAEDGNDPLKKDYAQQALTWLQRAVRRGHFQTEQVEPVFTVIRQLLPDVIV